MLVPLSMLCIRISCVYFLCHFISFKSNQLILYNAELTEVVNLKSGCWHPKLFESYKRWYHNSDSITPHCVFSIHIYYYIDVLVSQKMKRLKRVLLASNSKPNAVAPTPTYTFKSHKQIHHVVFPYNVSINTPLPTPLQKYWKWN